MKILADTNVFLDFLLKRDPYYKDVISFVNICKKYRHQIYINAMSFRDIEYIFRKSIKNEQQLQKILNSIYCFVDKIIPLTPDDVINAIFEPGNDFEDTLISNSGSTAMLDCLVTSNVKDFKNSKIKVVSLNEFVNRLNK